MSLNIMFAGDIFSVDGKTRFTYESIHCIYRLHRIYFTLKKLPIFEDEWDEKIAQNFLTILPPKSRHCPNYHFPVLSKSLTFTSFKTKLFYLHPTYLKIFFSILVNRESKIFTYTFDCIRNGSENMILVVVTLSPIPPYFLVSHSKFIIFHLRCAAQFYMNKKYSSLLLKNLKDNKHIFFRR